MASSDFPRLTLRDLFNADFYRATNPDLANLSDRAAFSHFENQGVFEGRGFSPFFDLDVYLSENLDVNSILGANRRVALAHFLNTGIFEGRRFSEPFNLDFYRSNNPDLSELDNSELFNHFLKAGLDEGRRFTPLVDLNFYRANNPDLRRLNNTELFNHFLNFGVNEGRQGISASLLELNFYRASNADLRSLSTNDLVNHFLNNGIAEGRRFSAFFDLNFYRENNPDLQFSGLNNQQLFDHFQRFGLDEGRRFSQFFDANYYLANNPDLRAAGFSPRQAFEHFVNFGLDEGRRPSLVFDPRYYLANNPDLLAQGLSFKEAFQEFQIGQPLRQPPQNQSGFQLARPASIFFDPDAIAPMVSSGASTQPERLQTADEWRDIPVGGTLTYSFVTTASAFLYERRPDFGEFGIIREVTPEIKNNVRNVMRQYGELIGLNLVEVPDRPPNVGRIRILFSDLPASRGGIVFSFGPSDFPGTGIPGDIHLNPAVNFAAGPGSFEYESLLFGVGGALGLNEQAGIPGGQGQIGNSVLPPAQKSSTNTVMVQDTPDDYNGVFASTPMSYDIRTLQLLYGASYLNNTDSVYTFVPGNFINIKQTIWDAGGTDTLDFSNLPALPPDLLPPGTVPPPLREGYYFDMNEGGHLTAQNALNRATYSIPIPSAGGNPDTPAPVIRSTTNVYNTTIAFGSEIENLIGSSGDDEILGNNLNNFIAGGGGDDIITGARGADIVAGGSGADIFVVAQGDGGPSPAAADLINDFTKGQDRIGLALGLPFGALAITQGTGANANDTLIRIASTGEYLAVLTGVRATDINFFDSTPV